MKRVKLSVVDALQKAIPSIVEGAGLRLATLKETIPADEGYAESEGTAEPVRVSMTFCPDPITTTWDWSDLDYKNSNDAPNWNLTIMALILAMAAILPLIAIRSRWNLLIPLLLGNLPVIVWAVVYYLIQHGTIVLQTWR